MKSYFKSLWALLGDPRLALICAGALIFAIINDAMYAHWTAVVIQALLALFAGPHAWWGLRDRAIAVKAEKDLEGSFGP
jgi:hypothetical protein